MAVTNLSRTTPQTLVISPASLASSGSFLAGRESIEAHTDATDTQWLDVIFQGFLTVGTTPTVDTQIRVYVVGSDTSLAATNLDVLDGADSDETLTSAGVRDSLLKLAHVINVDVTTSDLAYYIPVISLIDLFGNVPEYWGVFITHNTGVALNSTAVNHGITWQGLELDIV